MFLGRVRLAMDLAYGNDAWLPEMMPGLLRSPSSGSCLHWEDLMNPGGSSCCPSWVFGKGCYNSYDIKVLVTQSHLTLCDSMDCVAHQSPLFMGLLQARIWEWVTSPFSRASSQLRDQTWVSHIAGVFFTIWDTREAPLCNTLQLLYLCLYCSAVCFSLNNSL